MVEHGAGTTGLKAAIRIDLSGHMNPVEAISETLQDHRLSSVIKEAVAHGSGRLVARLADCRVAEPVAGSRRVFAMVPVVVGPAAAGVRRSVGPVAWCALRYLAASPCLGHGGGDTVVASVRSLAVGLGSRGRSAAPSRPARS